MLQDSSGNRGITAFIQSRNSLKVSCAFGNSAFHHSLYMSLEKEPVEAPEERENYFLHLLLIVFSKGILSLLVFPWCFPGAFARLVKRSVKAYFSEQSEGKPYSLLI
jgi:hypothetical protein